MDLSAVRILVVDDNRQAAEVVKSILGGLGAVEVPIARDVAEAYGVIRSEMIDLVIVDQNLGKGGYGSELVRRIRHDPTSPRPYLPIVMLTGYADERRVRAARDAGVNEFLVKPFTAAGLIRRIEALACQTRPFVRTAVYFGPDRRRRADPDYDGPERRAPRRGGGGDVHHVDSDG